MRRFEQIALTTCFFAACAAMALAVYAAIVHAYNDRAPNLTLHRHGVVVPNLGA
jgi:hypothetical protein